LLWDLDPQGSASFYFRIGSAAQGKLKKLVRGKRRLEEFIRASDYPGLDVLPADFAYRHLDLALDAVGKPRRRLSKLLASVRRQYDHIFLDCAPSISLVSEGVFRAADALLVPTIPTTLSLRTLAQLQGHLGREGIRGTRLLPFFSMVDRRKSLHREIVASREGLAREFLEASIPTSSVVERMGVQRAPLATFAAGSDADRAFRELWLEALSSLGSWLGWAGSPVDRGVSGKRFRGGGEA